MGTYLVQGGKRIEGEFAVRGSKNAALPILAACVLAADEVVLENLPQIRDVSQTLEILRELGCSGHADGADGGDRQPRDAGDRALRRSRAKNAFLHPFSGGNARQKRCGQDCVSRWLCDWQTPDRFAPCRLSQDGRFPLRRRTRFLIAGRSGCRGVGLICRFPSVGATENILLLAVCAEGQRCCIMPQESRRL